MLDFFSELRNSALFTGLADDELASVLSCLGAKTEAFSKNTCIILQGDKTESFGLLLSGRARIQREDIHGNQTIITDLAPGDMFGEAFAYAKLAYYPVTVWATVDSVVLFIPPQKLITSCQNACAFHTKLVGNLLNLMANKLVTLNRKIEIMQKTTIREKLLTFLTSEEQKNRSKSFTVPFSRQEMAEYIGANRSALSREMSQMQAEGLIKYKGNRFEILSAE